MIWKIQLNISAPYLTNRQKTLIYPEGPVMVSHYKKVPTK